MKDNPDIKLGVEGHTDNVGDRKNNSFQKTVKAVVSAIVKQGVNDPV
jgi:outer membrane protein OmpA-like peptidoglycan-associated protein